jgi:xanthine dehydrogenase YagS FAD-binding subunit
MQSFEYANPATLKDALALLNSTTASEEVAVLAGGTDLLSLMKDYIQTSRRIVNIKGIKELHGIQKTTAGVRLGSLVTMEELAEDSAIRADYPSLVTAARGISSPQIRNMGTIGGDLLQRPRCWYFRLGYGLLAKDANGKSLVPGGENKYHAIFGNAGPAYFVSPSSLAPALAALGAKVKLASSSGSREVLVEKLFVIPSNDTQLEHTAKPNEILTEILIPSAPGIRNATYEIRQKESLDWPLATASVALSMQGSTVARARIVLGHVAPIPWTASQAEQTLAGKSLTESAAQEAAQAAVADAKPLSQNAYKVQLARVAVKRALMEAGRGKA